MAAVSQAALEHLKGACSKMKWVTKTHLEDSVWGGKRNVNCLITKFKILIIGCCSVAKLYPTLYHPMDCSTPGSPVLHYLRKFAHTHVHWVSDAIQPSHPLSSPSPPAFNLSQHQGLFQRVVSISSQLNIWFLLVNVVVLSACPPIFDYLSYVWG